MLKQGGGQLWIFGGEFSNRTQSQFYHFKDLWMYSLKEKKWDKIKSVKGYVYRFLLITALNFVIISFVRS